MKLYSIFELLNAYKENKHLIDAYYKNKSVEGYSNNTKNVGNIDPRDFPIDPNNFPPIDTNKAINAGLSILGMGIGFFMFLLLINLGILIWSCILISNLNLKIESNFANGLAKAGLVLLAFMPGISFILFIVLLCTQEKKAKIETSKA